MIHGVIYMELSLVKEDMGRLEKMDESEEDEPLVLALLGSEE